MNKNTNPLYLIEGAFWKSLWGYTTKGTKKLINGAKYGADYVRDAEQNLKAAGNALTKNNIRIRANAAIEAEFATAPVADKITKIAQLKREVNEYLKSRSQFNSAKRNLGAEIKALPGRAVEGTKKAADRVWNGKPRPVAPVKLQDIDPRFMETGGELAAGLAATGAGIYGIKGALDAAAE